jgi:hypothetical protein
MTTSYAHGVAHVTGSPITAISVAISTISVAISAIYVPISATSVISAIFAIPEISVIPALSTC